MARRNVTNAARLIQPSFHGGQPGAANCWRQYGICGVSFEKCATSCQRKASTGTERAGGGLLLADY